MASNGLDESIQQQQRLLARARYKAYKPSTARRMRTISGESDGFYYGVAIQSGTMICFHHGYCLSLDLPVKLRIEQHALDHIGARDTDVSVSVLLERVTDT